MKNRTDKPHFQVAAGLIWRRGRLLIAKRPAGTHLAGLWEFPGGKKEPDEDLADCLLREIREELGITVRVGSRFFVVEHEYPAKSISLHVFHCDRVRGTPTPLESQEIRWVLPTDLRRYPFPPPDRKLVAFLARPRAGDGLLT